MPLDSETWHGEYSSRAFKKLFGIPKGLLAIHRLSDGTQHMYVPADYVKMLYRRIDQINRYDPKGLEKKLKTFFPLVEKAKKAVSRPYGNPTKFFNRQLCSAFFRIRDYIHRTAIFDQFGWIAEEYWTQKMERILTKKFGLKKDTKDYNYALFTLTKPEKLSITLQEKLTVLRAAIKIKERKWTLKKAGGFLARKYGWLPVFTYGVPWLGQHYQTELKSLLNRPLNELHSESLIIQNHEKIRRSEIADLIKKYRIDEQDLQIFVDFSLTISVRDGEEYFVSFASSYLLPLYQEIAKRLYVSVKQVRMLTERELRNVLWNNLDVQKILANKGKFVGWGFDKHLKKRIDYSAQETEKLFKFVEKHVRTIQGHDETRGLCASPGKVQGRIRIVPSPEQNNKVKDGDILVTYATTTDYLPAMKRAAAIITEVGGLTCHAAVVSREFNIPCIVALKNAMANFQDGELVELNADLGTVTKL